jgi:hypothetical protein
MEVSSQAIGIVSLRDNKNDGWGSSSSFQPDQRGPSVQKNDSSLDFHDNPSLEWYSHYLFMCIYVFYTLSE